MTNAKPEMPCTCGKTADLIDFHLGSATYHCRTCKRSELLVAMNGATHSIPLVDLFETRLVPDALWPYDDCHASRELIYDLLQSQIPSQFLLEAFGIQFWCHLHAARNAAYQGITAFDLNHVVGDGTAITRLMQIANRSLYQDVVFSPPPGVLKIPDLDGTWEGENWPPFRLEGFLEKVIFHMTARRTSLSFWGRK